MLKKRAFKFALDLNANQGILPKQCAGTARHAGPLVVSGPAPFPVWHINREG